MCDRFSLNINGHHLEGSSIVKGLGGMFFGALTLFAIRKWAAGGKCSIKDDLSEKVAVITGGNTGIGK